MLVHDCQPDRLEKNGMVTVVFVNMLGHLNKLVDSFDLRVDVIKQLAISRWGRKQLDNL